MVVDVEKHRVARPQLWRPDVYGVGLLSWGPPQTLGPGVVGFRVVDADGAVYFPIISAVRERQGDTGRWLDSQPVGSTWKVPTVVSDVLAGMLKRRGFVRTREWVAANSEWTDVWVRVRTLDVGPDGIGTERQQRKAGRGKAGGAGHGRQGETRKRKTTNPF